MTNYYFSASTLGFYVDLNRYKNLPSDIVAIADEQYVEFSGIPPQGKKLGASDSQPAWLDIVKTPEEQAAENMTTAASEYDRATVNIVALNEQIEDEDYAGTTEEAVKTELAAWTDYRKQLRTYIKAGDGTQRLPPALI
ncbi:hypothetical protein Zmor_008747 [Zophobas morio]|uniref:Tail fiber assembly protein n=1 Tax=Zophobas morio TaxID=2755281 RepID=A0AA38HM95_9CUCU|nr:hypothetical protein Zmor_008747 [Zophobas morio]